MSEERRPPVVDAEDEPSASSAADARRRAELETLVDLEWGRVVEAVAGRCRGPLREALGREGGATLALASDIEEARGLVRETEEALDARREASPLPLDGIRDVRASLARAEKLGVLMGAELFEIQTTLGAARRLRRFLAARRARMPELYARCALDPSLDALEEELAACLEPGGALADHASHELRRLRSEVANLRARIVSRLEAMLLEHEAVMSDRFLTQREGRYVLPVRTDAHDRIPGIVHGTSGSGATAFVEPRVVVEQQNRLTLAVAEMGREEQRILAQLSELVRERAAELGAALDALDRADLRDASARLAEDLRGSPPSIVEERRIEVREARHPLLVLDGVRVVPNDLELAEGHALVLSGPNAGGKTVALKLLGLFALMTRAGLPLPALAGAKVGFFGTILSDVGDDQSIEKNLSTFSAHVRSVARMLALAAPGTLVLLDEVATGTDPGEGGALACAIVEALCSRGAAVAVTTHYEPLKAMALTDARLRNAAVGFDVRAMAPTFHVRMDVPGASSALAVAARFGLDASVVERARALVPEQARTFDALVARLESEHESVRGTREALERDRRELAEVRRRLDEELAKQRARDKRQLSVEAERLLALVREAREEVRATRRAMRARPEDAELALAAKAALERAALVVGAEGPVGEAIAEDRAPIPGVAPELEDVRVGARFVVQRLRSEVEILEGPSKGRVRVAAGPLRLWVDIEELRAARSPREARPEAPRVEARLDAPSEPSASSGEPAPARWIRTEANSLDLRGMRVDDAVALVESFLDRLYGASEPAGFIVHGVGSGALRDAVRALLDRSPRYVRSFRRGTFDEGGDRLTVVELR